jgi:hypothetical protein
MASCVGNPGEFELGMHEGSTMEVVDAELATTFSLGIGVAPCADGLDNDLGDC